MINYLEDIKPLQDQGVSNEIIAQHLSARSAMPMLANEAVIILQESGAVIADPVMINQRSGSLIDFYKTLEPGPAQTLIAWFISEVFTDPSGQIGIDEYPRSIQFAQVESTLSAELQIVSSELVLAAGGRVDSGTTEEDVVAIQTQWEADEAARQAAEEAARQAEEQYQQDLETANAHAQQVQLLWNQNIAPLQDSQQPVTDPTVWQAALQAMADNWSN